MKNQVLWLRVPQDRLKNIILMHWYEDQQDQPLFDRVDIYTRDVALQVLNVIEIRLEVARAISQEELANFILSDDWIEPVFVAPRVLH